MMKQIGIIAVTLFELATAFLLFKWPRSNAKSISQHSASVRDAYIFYTIAQTIAGLLLYIFMIGWFIPHFHLSTLYTYVISATVCLQIVAAYFPDTTTGLKSQVHQALANGMALGMLVLTLLIHISNHFSPASRIIAIISVVYMLMGLSSVIFSKKAMTIYLPLQAIYISLFLLTIMIASYTT
jgi:hypothetical protein